MENIQNKQDHPTSTDETKVIGNYLVSALDMEDQINRSLYRDYLQRENWPAELKPEVFESIKKYLAILISDTQKHIEILSKLKEKYVDDSETS